MFYSHQLLARKAPLGQIWMAATMHAKMNRKKLDKLNLIKICEEILNPSVPMALRLSGILMGGVVIVYERKVKLLYDDVTRFMVEINEAWKVKAIPDPTVLPQGKSHAKYEAVTLPNNEDMEVGEIEESLHFSDTTNRMKFQQAGYFTMRLDDVDEPYVNEDPIGDDLSEHYHQADAANITLMDNIDSYQADTDLYNRFERFDIEGDEEDVQLNYTLREYSQVPITLVPSPPRQDETPQADEIQDQHPETEAKQQSDEIKEASQPQQDIKRRLPLKRKARTRAPQLAMDYEQTIIPGHVYQSWLTNPSDLVSKRGVRTRKRINPMSTMKVTNLMELPPVALSCGLFVNETREIYFPAPVLELWMRSTQFQPAHDGQKSPPPPPAPSSSAAPDGLYQGLFEYSVEDFHSGVGSQQWKPSREKLRTNLKNVEVPENFENNLYSIGVTANESNLMVTPGNSGGSVRSTAELPLHSGRRPYSSSKHSGSSLDPVAEDIPWLANNEPAFKLARLSENGSTPEHDLLVETGPTQTQYPVVHYPIDKITDTIRSHLKTHFDTPGAPQTESLFQLASGMNRKKAAQLFYQTCVLTSHGYLRVEQKVPYGDIFMSKGPKM